MMKHIAWLFLIFCTAAHAQVVDIPDPNLRAAISEALDGAPITQTSIRDITELDAPRANITDLTGLEHATQLRFLRLVFNQITDLTPLAGLRLNELWLWDNQVSDLSPLANMTTLTHLDLGHNRISDLSALTNLRNLEWLELPGNRITDVTPLAQLTRLNLLAVEGNAIFDHSPLDDLSLEYFSYDQTCDMPPLPLKPRLERNFPSTFSAFGGGIINQSHRSELEQLSQHDLYFCCLIFGGVFVDTKDGIVIVDSNMEDDIQQRDDFIARNPNMIFLAAFRWLFVDVNTYPADSPYWHRDVDGKISTDDYNGALVDITHPDVQREIIRKAAAIDKCGLYDGVFFDFWGEYGHSPANVEAMLAIVKGIRAVTRDNFLIMGNSNETTAPKTGSYLNGLFMESGVPGHWENASVGFTKLEETLSWGAVNLRLPHIIGLETQAQENEPLDSPTNLKWMRAATTLSLTFSDGYVLFMTDHWEGKHAHWHYWYDFWDADLGRPIGPKSTLYDDDIQGLYIREFTNGWAVYNHSGEAQVITLPEEVQGVASGLMNTEHALPNLDGEIYLRAKPKNPADVNGDGMVNILDLTIIARGLGTDNLEGDVNGDGFVNILDLVFVANHF